MTSDDDPAKSTGYRALGEVHKLAYLLSEETGELVRLTRESAELMLGVKVGDRTRHT